MATKLNKDATDSKKSFVGNHRRNVGGRKRAMRIQHGHRMAKLAVIGMVVAALVVFSVYYVASHNVQQTKNSDGTLTQSEVDKRDEALNIDKTEIKNSDIDSYKVAADRPRVITINSIGLKARIKEVGADRNQQMQAPTNIHDAGWYNCQNNPVASKRCQSISVPGAGNTSTAVAIDGHSCESSKDLDCVFDNLHKVKAGDTISIEMGDGTVINYRVDDVETADYNSKNDSEIMKRFLSPYTAGTEGLNIMTCAGDWTQRDSNGVATMDKRVIVYSTKI